MKDTLRLDELSAGHKRNDNALGATTLMTAFTKRAKTVIISDRRQANFLTSRRVRMHE